MKRVNLILFFILFVSSAQSSVTEKPERKYVPCGLYGFRCLDGKHAEICDEKYEEGDVFAQHRVFKCAEGLKCDEDKKEFCSPSNNCTCLEADKFKSKIKKLFNAKRSLTVASSSQEKENSVNDNSDEETVQVTEKDPWNGDPPFTCNMHGFFPDNGNKSLFFFCDIKKSGNGFFVRHMRCGPDRVFESNLNACVLRGTTRNIRNGNDEPDSLEVKNSTRFTNFSCIKRKPGKYPDDDDCRIYHLCLHPDLFSPFEHLVVQCPRSTAYDSQLKKCSKNSAKLCNKRKVSNVFCGEETRFRETRSCNHYFLCFQDQVIEFTCPPGLKFDENLQYCESQQLVECL